jgi:hypothetical protein
MSRGNSRRKRVPARCRSRIHRHHSYSKVFARNDTQFTPWGARVWFGAIQGRRWTGGECSREYCSGRTACPCRLAVTRSTAGKCLTLTLCSGGIKSVWSLGAEPGGSLSGRRRQSPYAGPNGQLRKTFRRIRSVRLLPSHTTAGARASCCAREVVGASIVLLASVRECPLRAIGKVWSRPTPEVRVAAKRMLYAVAHPLRALRNPVVRLLGAWRLADAPLLRTHGYAIPSPQFSGLPVCRRVVLSAVHSLVQLPHLFHAEFRRQASSKP